VVFSGLRDSPKAREAEGGEEAVMEPIQWFADRLRRRWFRALAIGVIGGTMLVVSDWLGLPGKSRPWSNPRPLSDVWWRFPLAVAFLFVVFLFMPNKALDRDRAL
jgi:hypothetical protein